MKNKLLTIKRKEKGFTADRIAKDLNISRKTLYRKEQALMLTENDINKFSKYYKIRKKDIRENYEVKRNGRKNKGNSKI